MKNFNFMFFLSVFTLISCGPKMTTLKFNDSSIHGLNENDESFIALKSKILIPKCLSCHSKVDSVSGISPWIKPGDPEHSLLYTEVKNGNMPKGKPQLSGVELELVYDFINQLQSAPEPTPTPVPAPSKGITYSQIRSRVLVPYGCTSCHSVGTEARLSKWGNSFYTSVKSGSMPRGGRDVTASDQAFILQYLKDYSSRN